MILVGKKAQSITYIMVRYLIPAILLLVLFYFLYSIYKNRYNSRPRQIAAAITGALLLGFLLYTCNSDEDF